MGTVSEDLDTIQLKLHDSGVLWPRAELLRWYNDGYRELVAKSAAVSRWRAFDVPGRVQYAITQEWESHHCPGTVHCWSLQSQNKRYACTNQWEVELLAGVTPTNSLTAYSQPWERSYTTDGDRHYSFFLPANSQRVKHLAWDDVVLTPTSVRELDSQDTGWMRVSGQPDWWLEGVGRSRTVEVYEIETDYRQAYEATGEIYGTLREITGDRTYEFTYDSEDGPVGVVRSITSSDREYVPDMEGTSEYAPVGTARDWKSSDDSLLALVTITPEGELTEEDKPWLVPSQLQKYLRYSVLSRAFGRQGEGYNPNLSVHYKQRFEAGIKFFNLMGDITRRDAILVRESVSGPATTRPARPRLPSTYPRVW